MRGKVCLVTGANSGIGQEIARGLGAQGAHVVLWCRNDQKAQAAAEEIRGTAQATVDIVLGDLASLASVRRTAAEVLERFPRLDIIVSNAGVFRLRRKETVDGHEEVLAVNHLAPFLLVDLLRPSLPSGARIVVVASEAHRGQRLDLDNLQLTRRYTSWHSYGRSKLCNIMFTYALARRLEGSGITANCLHPGFVATGLGSGNRIPVRPFYALMRPFTKTPAEGADTAVWLASSRDLDGLSGGYFSQRRPARSSSVSYDVDLQEALWMESARLTAS